MPPFVNLMSFCEQAGVLRPHMVVVRSAHRCRTKSMSAEGGSLVVQVFRSSLHAISKSVASGGVGAAALGSRGGWNRMNACVRLMNVR